MQNYVLAGKSILNALKSWYVIYICCKIQEIKKKVLQRYINIRKKIDLLLTESNGKLQHDYNRKKLQNHPD